jgi:uncharacterized protein (DUF1697 family)
VSASDRQVSLLRGINVGGNNRIPMAGLRRLYEGLGATDVTTHLQSGNVVFGHAMSPDRFSTKVEEAIENQLGLHIRVLGRDRPQMARIAADPVFPTADPAHYIVLFLSGTPAAAGVRSLIEAAGPDERLEAVGDELHIDYGQGVGRSKLTAPLLDRLLGVVGTGRNWRTVSRLAKLVDAPD